MIKLDEKKLAQLKTGSQHFDEKYGPAGSPSRVEFEAKAKAWFCPIGCQVVKMPCYKGYATCLRLTEVDKRLSVCVPVTMNQKAAIVAKYSKESDAKVAL